MVRTRFLIVVCSAFAPLACGNPSTDPLIDPDAPVASLGPIAFASSRGARWQSPDIYTANSDGSGVTKIATGTNPAWSSDGRLIAFNRPANPYGEEGVYIVRSDGKHERFVSLGRHPAWSPDGWVVYALDGIWMTNLTGSSFRPLLDEKRVTVAADAGCDEGSRRGTWVDYPTWSPDGGRIAFLLQCGDGRSSRAFLMNADGSEVVPLSDGGRAGPPSWSPDGSTIAAWIDGVITTIDVNSHVHEVHEVLHPLLGDGIPGWKLDWSPDGRQIVFSGGPSDVVRIFLLTLETGAGHQLIADLWPDYYADFDVAWARVTP